MHSHVTRWTHGAGHNDSTCNDRWAAMRHTPATSNFAPTKRRRVGRLTGVATEMPTGGRAVPRSRHDLNRLQRGDKTRTTKPYAPRGVKTLTGATSRPRICFS